MDLYRRVRLACHIQDMSSRTAAPNRPKLEGFTPIIDGYIEDDKLVPRKHRHTAKRIFERLKVDLAAMQALPATSFDACHKQAGRVTSQSLVRYKGNNYSVPVAYGHREVWIRRGGPVCLDS